MVMKSLKSWDFLSQFYGFIIVITFMCLFWIVYAIHMSGPRFLTESDNDDDFIGQNAQNYLKSLTSFGPRIMGGPINEEITIDFLENAIHELISNKHVVQDIEIDRQIQSGYNYFKSYNSFGTYRMYEAVQNVIVRIKSDKRADQDRSVLVNSHFDTVPQSPGGSDAGIMISIMLETLRVMSRLPQKPKNDVIFLFNGAEEVGLLASHAFIKHHHWASSCKFLVNLEATGADGKAILFQSGPGNSWLLDYYADVPHPHGQAAGEELFQSGIVPSDTDFRVFRDIGGMIGFDIAFYQDGYRYHTQYDGFKNIDEEWFQHTGDNVLHLVRKMAYDEELQQKLLDNEDSKQKAVYFDFIGGFFIYYGKAAELAINILTIIISITSCAWSFYKIPTLDLKSKTIYSLVSICFILLGWIIGAAFNIAVGSILDAANRTMTWYASNSLIFSLYCLPALWFTFASINAIKCYTRRRRKSFEGFTKLLQAEYLCHLYRTIWTVVLIVLTAIGLRSAYLFVPYVLFTSVGFIIGQCLALWRKSLESVWIPIYIIALVMPSMFTAYNTVTIFQLFLPVMGRFGDGINPELIVGGLATFLTIAYVCTCAPFMIVNKNAKYFYIVMSAVYVIFIIVLTTPAAFPYSYSKDVDNPKPQRYNLCHARRNIRNDDNEILVEDAGITFNAADRNSPFIIEDDLPELKDRISLEAYCETAIFCGLPNSMRSNFSESSIWLPTIEFPKFPWETSLKLMKQVRGSINIYKYTFELKGPNRMNIFISPRPGLNLVDLSLIDGTIVPEKVGWKDQMVYYFKYTSGRNPNTLNFDMTLQDMNQLQPDKKLDIVIVGSHVHDDLNEITEGFQKILDKLPDWTTNDPQLAVYDNYVF